MLEIQINNVDFCDEQKTGVTITQSLYVTQHVSYIVVCTHVMGVNKRNKCWKLKCKLGP